MRYTFIKELTKQAKKNKQIILLTADLGFTVFESFAKALPKQFINVGVAEANMIGTATGLELSGKIVFCYSIATFASMRTFEQIRNDVCAHNASVTIVGSGAGLSYSDAGTSHHALEDIAIIRSLPNMHVLCPADPVETTWATAQAISLAKPVYLRLGKKGEPIIPATKKLTLGKARVLKKGPDVVIIATGNIVYTTLLAATLLEKQGIHATVLSIHTVKPLDKKLLITLASAFPLFVTVEEHSIIGGLGSAVAEVVSELKNPPQLKRIGLPDTFVHIGGTHAYLRSYYGLSAEAIATTIRGALP